MLGLVALVRGQLDQAKERLRAAGKATTTPQLASFGPDLELAAALVGLGQRQAVVGYLNDCRSFWPTGGEKIDRMTKALEADALPWEFRALLKSPFVGQWLAAETMLPGEAPRESLVFTEDGRLEPSIYGERHTTFRREGDKVIIADPEAPDRRDKDDVFELKGDRLFIPKDGEELPFTLPKDGLRRLDEADAKGRLAGTWSSSMRFEGMGNAQLTWTFDGDDAGNCAITVRAPTGVSFRYAVIGDRLVYTFADSSVAALGPALKGAEARILVRSSTWKVDDDVLTIDDYWHAEPSGDKRRTFERLQPSNGGRTVR